MQYAWMVITTTALIMLASCTPASPTNIKNNPATEMLMPIANDTFEPVWSVTAAHLSTSNAYQTDTPEAYKTELPLQGSSTTTPATDFSKYADSWRRYSNEAYGISFEYPAVYDISPYKDDNCGVKVSTLADGAYIDVGMRISLAIIEAGSSTLTEYVDSYLKDKQGVSFTLTSRTNTTVGGEEAITLEYRFGGPNRYGTVTYFKHDDKIFGLNFTAGVFCESVVTQDTKSGITELGTYAHILESFEFNPP